MALATTIVQAGVIVGLAAERGDQPLAGRRNVVAGGPDRLNIEACLFAQTATGQRLTVPQTSMGVGLWRRGISAIWKQYAGPALPEDPEAHEQALANYRVQRHDVEDAINQLLGRDPEQHRPPRLSWEPLIRLLARIGITVTENELIAMPFRFEFTEALLAELAGERG